MAERYGTPIHGIYVLVMWRQSWGWADYAERGWGDYAERTGAIAEVEEPTRDRLQLRLVLVNDRLLPAIPACGP